MQKPQYLLSPDTRVGPSPSIWADCPWMEMLHDPGVGYWWWDDFIAVPPFTTNGTTNFMGYTAYLDDGCTILPVTDEVGGVLEIAGNDADNDEAILTTGANTAGCFKISDTAGSDKKLWFETRIKKASIGDNGCAFFCGLAEEGLAAVNTLIDDSGVLADKDFIGFSVLQDNGEELDFTYEIAGQTAVEAIANVADMVADTYMKVGFKYDPNEETAKRIKIYVNGTEQSTWVTGTNIATATFPDDQMLAMLLATKVGTAAESKFQMDWWRCAQLR